VLLQLYKAGKISIEQALINADSANNLRLKIKLAGLKGDDAVAALLDKSDRDEKGFQIQGQLGQGGSKKR
jgi:twitching motility protein PilU